MYRFSGALVLDERINIAIFTPGGFHTPEDIAGVLMQVRLNKGGGFQLSAWTGRTTAGTPPEDAVPENLRRRRDSPGTTGTRHHAAWASWWFSSDSRFLLVRCLNVSCRLHRQTARVNQWQTRSISSARSRWPHSLTFIAGIRTRFCSLQRLAIWPLIARTSGLISSCASS